MSAGENSNTETRRCLSYAVSLFLTHQQRKCRGVGAGEELAYKETAVVEEGVSAMSVSLLWTVMSALLL